MSEVKVGYVLEAKDYATTILQRAQRQIGVIQRMATDMRLRDRAFKWLKMPLNIVKGMIDKIIASLKRMAMLMTATAIGGVTALTAQSLRLSAAYESSLISFKTILGSAKEATKLMDDIEKFAATTPFNMPNLVNASQKLLAFGYSSKELFPILKSVGDAVAGLGGDQANIERLIQIFGKIKAMGRLTAREIMQLSQMGIPALNMLAEKTGQSVTQVMADISRGAIKADEAIGLILGSLEQRFGGLMAQQSKSLSGLWSTAIDNFQISLRKFGSRLAPIAKGILGGLISVFEYLNKLNWFEKMGDTFASVFSRENIAKAITWLANMGQFAVNVFKWVGNVGGGAFKYIVDLVKWLGDYLGGDFFSILKTVGTYAIRIAAAIAGWKVFGAFAHLAMHLKNPIAIAGALAAGGATFGYLQKKGDDMVKGYNKMATDLENTLKKGGANIPAFPKFPTLDSPSSNETRGIVDAFMQGYDESFKSIEDPIKQTAQHTKTIADVISGGNLINQVLAGGDRLNAMAMRQGFQSVGTPTQQQININISGGSPSEQSLAQDVVAQIFNQISGFQISTRRQGL